MNWYFDMESEEYGAESFGPYDSWEEAMKGIERVMRKGADLADDVERMFSPPYECEHAGVFAFLLEKK